MGENKVQELRDKDAVLAGTGAERHFIGHLQTNKVKDMLKYVSCVQSVDRMPVAEALGKQLLLAAECTVPKIGLLWQIIYGMFRDSFPDSHCSNWISDCTDGFFALR